MSSRDRIKQRLLEGDEALRQRLRERQRLKKQKKLQRIKSDPVALAKLQAKRRAAYQRRKQQNPEYLKHRAELQQRWYYRNKAVHKLRMKASLAKLRAAFIIAYGNQCNCCGELNPMFLTVDHIHSDPEADGPLLGLKLTKQATGKMRPRIKSLLRALKRLGWPKDRHQLLCFNCNCGRQRNHGVCPHQQETIAPHVTIET